MEDETEKNKSVVKNGNADGTDIDQRMDQDQAGFKSLFIYRNQ
jgi:hypothetical protein